MEALPPDQVAALEGELKRLKAEQRKQVMRAGAQAAFDQAFGPRAIYYVQEHDKVYEYNRAWREPWTFYSCKAFMNELPVLQGPDGWLLFTTWLKENGRYFYKTTYSFVDQPPTMLNRMRTGHWLKPVQGPVNRWYDVLMRALGGGTEEGANHIEQLLVWKYQHPSDFLLPCVNWFDEGGVGKNLFVDGILGAIFGREQVASVGLDNLIGPFNSVIKGKTVVLMNEAANRKVDMEKFKMMVGQPDLFINEKMIPQYRVDNTPLYFIATNDPMSIPLEGKKSDRRWSVIHLKKSIEAFVAAELGISELDAKRLWVDQLADQLKEPANLSAWLHHLMWKWCELDRPEPLHGYDYDRMISIKDELNPVKEAVELISHMETWVPVKDLYLYVVDAYRFDRQKMWVDYRRFCAELSSLAQKAGSRFIYEPEKKHHTRGGGLLTGQPACGAIVRFVDYEGPFTKGHFEYASKDLRAEVQPT